MTSNECIFIIYAISTTGERVEAVLQQISTPFVDLFTLEIYSVHCANSGIKLYDDTNGDSEPSTVRNAKYSSFLGVINWASSGSTIKSTCVIAEAFIKLMLFVSE